MTEALLMVALTAYIRSHPDDSGCLNDGSAPDDRSYSLFRVLTPTAQTYTESLLNDGSAPDGRFYSLFGSSP